MQIRMNPEAARLYRTMSPEGKEHLYQWLKANGYCRPTFKERVEASYEAMDEVLKIIFFALLTLVGLSLCIGIPILTVRMVLENWQAILKIVGG